MTVVGVRAETSLGVRRYCDRLQDALAVVGVDYRPAERPHKERRTHWHFANSSRRPLWQAMPAVTVLRVAGLTVAWSCSAITSTVMSWFLRSPWLRS